MSGGCFGPSCTSTTSPIRMRLRGHFLDFDQAASRRQRSPRRGWAHRSCARPPAEGKTCSMSSWSGRKGVSQGVMMGAEQVQRETAATRKDVVAPVGCVEASEHVGGSSRYRAGRGDRDATPLLAIGRRDQLHMRRHAAHRITGRLSGPAGSSPHISLRNDISHIHRLSRKI